MEATGPKYSSSSVPQRVEHDARSRRFRPGVRQRRATGARQAHSGRPRRELGQAEAHQAERGSAPAAAIERAKSSAAPRDAPTMTTSDEGGRWPRKSAAAFSRAVAEVAVMTRSMVSPGRDAGIPENGSARRRKHVRRSPCAVLRDRRTSNAERRTAPSCHSVALRPNRDVTAEPHEPQARSVERRVVARVPSRSAGDARIQISSWMPISTTRSDGI